MRGGHQVRVLTSRGRYFGGRGEAPLREVRNGVEIHRVRASSFGKGRALGRMMDYASFHLLAGVRAAFSGWPDLVITLTTPPLLGIWGEIARSLGARRHVPFVMDLHPDAEFELGVLRRESRLGRLLEHLNAMPLRRADRCVVLGPYMAKRLFAKGVHRARVTEIPIWSDKDEITPLEHNQNPLRDRLGWNGRFVVLYSGNAGWVHRFDELNEAMQRVQAIDPRILFAFVGGGPRTAEIQDFAQRQGLTNVEFHPYFAREELGSLLPAADLHFVSLAPEQAGVAVPGKLYGCLASGRPVLFVGTLACESASAVRSSGAGYALPTGRGEELARCILELAADPEACAERGAKGRAYFLEHHEREQSCERWRELIEEVLYGRRVRREVGEEAVRVQLEVVDPPMPEEDEEVSPLWEDEPRPA